MTKLQAAIRIRELELALYKCASGRGRSMKDIATTATETARQALGKDQITVLARWEKENREFDNKLPLMP